MNGNEFPLALGAVLETGLATVVVIVSVLLLRELFIHIANRSSKRR